MEWSPEIQRRFLEAMANLQLKKLLNMVTFIDVHIMFNSQRVDHHWDTYQPNSFGQESCIVYCLLVLIWRVSLTSNAIPDNKAIYRMYWVRYGSHADFGEFRPFLYPPIWHNLR